MAVFSTNQVRHFYLVDKIADTASALKDIKDLSLQYTKDANNKEMVMSYKGPGGITGIDKIQIKNIDSVSFTDEKALSKPYTPIQHKVTFNEEANGGEIVEGQEYILRMLFMNYGGLGIEDQYSKFGVVFTFKGMDKSDFFKKLAISLAKNLGREINSLAKVYVAAGSALTEVKFGTKLEDLTAVTADSLVLEETLQDWRLGTMPLTKIPFHISFGASDKDGIDPEWGKVEKELSKTEIDISGLLTADLEYFCMGERGDSYRMMGFPNIIPTKYLVDETKSYVILDIAYYFVDEGIGSQKSQKVLTLAAVKGSEGATKLEALAKTLNGETEPETEPEA